MIFMVSGAGHIANVLTESRTCARVPYSRRTPFRPYRHSARDAGRERFANNAAFKSYQGSSCRTLLAEIQSLNKLQNVTTGVDAGVGICLEAKVTSYALAQAKISHERSRNQHAGIELQRWSG